MGWALTIDNLPRLASSSVKCAVAVIALVLATSVGPGWLSTIPDWLVFPISQWVGDSLTWFAREASIGGLAVQEITRGFAELINKPIEAAVVIRERISDE